MKRILGLDLGVSSIGWALVEEAESKEEKSSIVKLGVRVNPLTTDEQTDFEKGKSITTNADRTLKRGMRRNLQRYKLRRECLIKTLQEHHLITDETVLAEVGSSTTFQTLRLRAKAAEEQISLDEFARVLLMINKKRGYKSNRKCKSSEEDGQAIDSILIAKSLYEEDITPGQYVNAGFKASNKFSVPEFYRSDLQAEFDRVWAKQSEFYPQLTDELYESLSNKNTKQTGVALWAPLGIVGKKRNLRRDESVRDNYRIRAAAVNDRLDLEEVAIALQEINRDIRNSSGYLGDISDRSKQLVLNNMTVGQYQMSQLDRNPNSSLKNQVFYRADYMDEFEKLWSVQSKYHPELTETLKHEIRDMVIFYQRPLKSQKSLVGECDFEHNRKVCPKSSPLFQEFRILQVLNNLTAEGEFLSSADKGRLLSELQCCSELKDTEIKKILKDAPKNSKINYKKIEGNKTQCALFAVYRRMLNLEESAGYDDVLDALKEIDANVDALVFDYTKDPEDQPFFSLWHLLYSYAGDNSKSGIDKLVKKVAMMTNLSEDDARQVAGVSFEPDYGSLSAKAIKKILPYLKEGYVYSDACEMAGYRHSPKSLTREEIESKEYKDRLEGLKKNSLRNPVVEKILNQMVNVVNAVIDQYGKPDEVRIELARELKKSAAERAEATDGINQAEAENKKIVEELKTEYSIVSPSRNDITRLKLYKELKAIGYKTLYSNRHIEKDDIFSNALDIEHIIPQARLFDDSFSNKTLEFRDVNIEKANRTAYDYVLAKYGEEGAASYEARVDNLLKGKAISKTKARKLLMKESEIPEGFINRDLRDSQYIAKQAKEMLEGLVKYVVTTTGSVTARLREDWQLVNVMQELNWDKYDKLGLTHYEERKDGQRVKVIDDWTKRNDHRHHAMDALTIAFTKRSYIQYLNNLNARVPKVADDYETGFRLDQYGIDDLFDKDKTRAVMYIQNGQMYRDNSGKLRFYPPMPLDEFRREAMHQLDEVLVSIKAKNKVVTRNENVTKNRGSEPKRMHQLTPRGQMHKESVYGKSFRYETKEEKVGASLNKEKILSVACPAVREALLGRLAEFGGDPKKAFTGRNTLEKNPLFIDKMHTAKVPEKVKTVKMVPVFTIRKLIDPSLSVDKVLDEGVKKILQARLEEYGGDAKKAFSSLEENPIWLNREKGIQIKRVTIDAGLKEESVEPIHVAKNVLGDIVLDGDGKEIPCDYVAYGNNHHVAIYQDNNGDYQEFVVPFYEAVRRASAGEPIVDRDYRKGEGWQFLFSMKQNEYFVFPNPKTGFDPSAIDLTDPANYAAISPNLYRVQKLSSKYYNFRHHLETAVGENSELRDVTWKRITNLAHLKGVVKVRVNHIGQIVQVGEY